MRTCPTCQRVKADRQPPSSLLFPLPVPTRRGGCIGLDFLELPVARSGHDSLQVPARGAGCVAHLRLATPSPNHQ